MDKNRDLTDNIFRAPCMFCKESLGKINAKVVELLRNGFEALITLGQVTTSGVEKKKSVHELNFDGEATWLFVSLFAAMIEMTCHVHHVFALWL